MINYDKMNAMNYNDYINEQIYSILVERVVDHFINQSTIDSLVGTVMNMIGGDNTVLGIVRSTLFADFKRGETERDIYGNMDSAEKPKLSTDLSNTFSTPFSKALRTRTTALNIIPLSVWSTQS